MSGAAHARDLDLLNHVAQVGGTYGSSAWVVSFFLSPDRLCVMGG